ncbi:hypothetical protein VTN00DRAFT_5680 [Thermoascus crustaceus]|uniref:uncharacterized protein n=1 Tax=Thermoascus crustaceus TaxID=5088 RepID=UPI003743BFDC
MNLIGPIVGRRGKSRGGSAEAQGRTSTKTEKWVRRRDRPVRSAVLASSHWPEYIFIDDASSSLEKPASGTRADASYILENLQTGKSD